MQNELLMQLTLLRCLLHEFETTTSGKEDNVEEAIYIYWVLSKFYLAPIQILTEHFTDINKQQF